jgi:taurine dioxygenase
MAQSQPPKEKAQYNEAAMSTAVALQEARSGLRETLRTREIPRERLFPAFNRAGLGVALEYERMGNRPVSEELQSRADALGFELEHLALTLGTVIHGIDLRGEDPELAAFVRATLLERKVIFFRDQHLKEEEQVAFGRRFGDLDAFPFGPPGEDPFILEIKHGRNSPGAENGWHTDVTWMERPSLGSIAQCVELPPYGGDTLFADSHAAYLGMRPALQERLQHLHGINDYRNFVPTKGPIAISEELLEEIKGRIPFGVDHPLLRTHPETGKTALYFHGGFLRHESLYDIRTGETLPPEESRAIVQELQAQHGRPEYICRFGWEPGSVAFWDNRAVQHYAASDYFPHRRVLRRVTVSGDVPYYEPAS